MPGEELLDERELEVDRDHATAARLRGNACAEPVPPGDRLAKRDQREVAAAVQDVEREVDLVSANQDGELDRARVEWQLDACRLDRHVRSKPGRQLHERGVREAGHPAVDPGHGSRRKAEQGEALLSASADVSAKANDRSGPAQAGVVSRGRGLLNRDEPLQVLAQHEVGRDGERRPLAVVPHERLAVRCGEQRHADADDEEDDGEEGRARAPGQRERSQPEGERAVPPGALEEPERRSGDAGR